MVYGSWTHRKSYLPCCLTNTHPLTHGTSYSSHPPVARPLATTPREPEEPCSSAGVQGAGPLVTAKRASSPSVEGWREVWREEGNHALRCVPFLSLSIT